MAKMICPICGGRGRLDEVNAQTGHRAAGQCYRCNGTGFVESSADRKKYPAAGVIGLLVAAYLCYVGFTAPGLENPSIIFNLFFAGMGLLIAVLAFRQF